MRAVLVAAGLLAIATPAWAHQPYTGKKDPVTNSSCCGSADCAIFKIEPGMLTGETDGYRLRLTEEQAKRINPARSGPVNTLIKWERIQPSWDGNFHLCLPNYAVPNMIADFYCFWAPPNS